MGHRIVIPIEPDIRCLADPDFDTLEQRSGIVGQLHQVDDFFREYLAHRALRLGRTAPVGRHAGAPGLGLSIEVVEIGEAAGGEE